MRKALVTGGAGFLGSHLVDSLLGRGVEVVAIDNLFRGSLKNLEAARTSPHFHFVNGDILNTSVLQEAAKGCNIIYHLAAINGTKYFYEVPQLVLGVNIAGTENVLKVAQEEQVHRVLFTSTSEVYGRTSIMPTPEDSGSLFSPSTGVRWCYAISKLVDEHMCRAYTGETGLETIIVRIFNAYGPRQVSSEYGQVVGIFARQVLAGQPPIIYGDGRQTRSFTYVSDIIDGIIKAAELDGVANDVFNLGSQEEITINELAETMTSLVGMTQKLKPLHADATPDEPRRRCPSIEKAKMTFGYDLKVSLVHGLAKTIDWFGTRGDSPFSGGESETGTRQNIVQKTVSA